MPVSQQDVFQTSKDPVLVHSPFSGHKGIRTLNIPLLRRIPLPIGVYALGDEADRSTYLYR